MNDPGVRASLLRLIFAFPVLMAVTCPQSGPFWPTVTAIAGAELILVIGLVIAHRERRRLLANQGVFATAQTIRHTPHIPTSRAARVATIGRSRA